VKKIKKISIAVLLLLIIVAAASYLFYRFNFVNVSEEKEINKSFTAINIHADYAGVEVFPTDDSKTKIKIAGKKSSGTKLNLSSNVEGKTLSIQLNMQQKKLLHFGSLSTVLIKVYVPQKQYEMLKVHNDFGHIKMDGIHVKNLNAKTKNGEMKFSQMNATNVVIQSEESGPIQFKGVVTGKMVGKTHDGKINFYTPNIDFPVNLETYNGMITIKTDKKPKNVTYDVHSNSGANKYKKGYTKGNGDNLIQLKTHSGKINIISGK
jgi:DUF4097 and DUF4098 domain-containing protein YvlB